MNFNFPPSRSIKLVALLLMVSLATVFLTEPAFSLCADPPEDGNWVNTDPNTRGITKINLRFVCQDQILNGELYPPGPPWYMHIWGKCHPNDCDWGEVGAREVNTSTRDFIYTVYRQGFATRYVYASMSIYRPGQLWVYIWTDFADPNRPDYEMHNWFRLQ
ncbi:MAG: hypothetical protein JSU85_14910 [Candidatus Zixiibacteriota bacterium]|nr:MAG: hypothetical protein JSU85_14910 [candidate division Zixibacteria bacterium]